MTTTEVLEMNRPMKQRLFDFPGEIRAQKERVKQARRALKDAQATLNACEAEIVAVICAAVNSDTGKAAFSNDKTRDAEIVRRKANNPTCKAAELAVRAAEEEASVAEFDLERLFDEFQAYRYVVDLTARELALLAPDYHSNGRAAADKRGPGRTAQPY